MPIVLNINDKIQEVTEYYLEDNVEVFKSTTPGPDGPVGPQGLKGDTGISVHHTKGTHTTDPEGDFSAQGEKDTYTMYGDANETIILGWFTIQNGADPYTYALAGGYTGSKAEFNTSLSSITAIEVASQLAQWNAEANEMTTDSFANEAEDVEVKIYHSNGDGTFGVSIQSGQYSALHYQIKTRADYELTVALGNGYVVADNTEKDALTTLTTADTVFVSDDGDGKWARYQVTAVTDGLGSTSTFKKIMDEDTYLHANTAADVKATYESNADTNAFTDVEKTSVDITTVLDTTATTLPQAVNEVHGELNNHIVDTEDAHDASAISYVPGTNTYAIGTDINTVIDQLDAEAVAQDGRLDTAESKLNTIESGATADQTATEIETLYEGIVNTNKFTDVDKQSILNNAQAIANLATAQSQISNDDVTVITTTNQTLSFTTDTGSTDSDILIADDSTDTITFLTNASYNFTSSVTFASTTNSTVNITFDLIDVATGLPMATEIAIMNTGNGDTEIASIITLLTIGKNGLPEAPCTMQIKVRANSTGYSIPAFHSILASSSSYDVTTNAVGISIVPSGAISATNVQAAIEELDTEKQPKDGTLTALAGVTTSADKLIYATGADTFTTTTLTAAGRALIDDTSAAAQRTTLGVSATNTPSTAVGNIAATNVQAALQELDTEKEPKNANIQSHISSTINPHAVTKTQVGLGNVDNTSDANKPISAATSNALSGKVDKTSVVTTAITSATFNADGTITIEV